MNVISIKSPNVSFTNCILQIKYGLDYIGKNTSTLLFCILHVTRDCVYVW